MWPDWGTAHDLLAAVQLTPCSRLALLLSYHLELEIQFEVLQHECSADCAWNWLWYFEHSSAAFRRSKILESFQAKVIPVLYLELLFQFCSILLNLSGLTSQLSSSTVVAVWIIHKLQHPACHTFKFKIFLSQFILAICSYLQEVKRFDTIHYAERFSFRSQCISKKQFIETLGVLCMGFILVWWL